VLKALEPGGFVITEEPCRGAVVDTVAEEVPSLADEVLTAWNIGSARVLLISRRGNVHWKVQHGNDAFVVRAYRRTQSAASIAYEHRVLRHLGDRGWAVATPIADVIAHQGTAFALFPFLHGRPRLEETSLHQRARGQILARLHLDLDSMVSLGQRSDFQRADEAVVASALWAEQRSVSGDNVDAALVSEILVARERVCERLDSLASSRWPVTMAHGDLIAQNLLFHRDRLSGVLDFDAVHIDLRAADLACARRSRHDEVVRGYLEVAELSDVECAALDDLWRASVLGYASWLLRGNTIGRELTTDLEWCVKQLRNTESFAG
jgi:Ser/Thr protein kinase RdoA (MazF antagonist)